MKEILSTHCSIRSGITLRKNTAFPAPDTATFLLRIKDIESLEITPDYSSPVTIDASTDRFRVHAGDTLFSSRGKSCKASVMPEHSGTFIAPSQLYIITPNDPSSLLPGFLALYLSSSTAEQFFKINRKGSLVQIITKKSLSDLPLTVPPIEQQQKIIHLHQLSEQEKEIQHQINALRVKQFEHTLNHLTSQHSQPKHFLLK